MNKSELIRAMSAKSGSTVKDAEKLLNAFVEAVTEVVSKGDDVTLIGFGTFSVAKTSARIGRNLKLERTSRFLLQSMLNSGQERH